MALALVAYNVLRLSATNGGEQGASVEISCPQVPVDYTWRVDGLVVMANNPSGQTPYLLAYDLPPGPGVVPCAGTKFATFDVGDGLLTVLGGDQLILVVANLDAANPPDYPMGTTAYVRVQYGVWQGSQSGKPLPILQR